MDVTDVLSAMGALPSGFRPSLLHSSQQNTDRFSLRHAILPRVTESKLGYRDLYWDSANQKVSYETWILLFSRFLLMLCSL